MIRFTLPRPISVNAMYRNVPGKGRVKSALYKAWLQTAMAEIMVQRVGQPMPHRPVTIMITLPDSHGRADCSNYIKSVEDALVKMAVIVDDNDKYIRRVTAQIGAPEGTCIVEIEPLTATIPHEGKVS